MKVSSHWVRSPLLSINRSCQTCHNVPEEELHDRVKTIQGRTQSMLDRAALAMTEMLDAVRQAQASGVDESALEPIYELQKKAMWRLDHISSENSLGFHADQEAVRILGESIDFSRQAQAAAAAMRAPEPPVLDGETKPVRGVTPTDEAPPARSTNADPQSPRNVDVVEEPATTAEQPAADASDRVEDQSQPEA